MGVDCVPLLISEGRAALVTSYSMFKYMATYSMIQFTSVVILFTHFAAFSNWAYLYIDLLVIDLVVLTMSRNYPCKFVCLMSFVLFQLFCSSSVEIKLNSFRESLTTAHFVTILKKLFK